MANVQCGIRKGIIMASKEMQGKSLREFLTEKADKITEKQLRQKLTIPPEKISDVVQFKMNSDPDKLASTKIKLGIESDFMVVNKEQITIFQFNKIIRASGNAGIIRGRDGNFSGFGKIDKTITAWGNAGTIRRK